MVETKSIVVKKGHVIDMKKYIYATCYKSGLTKKFVEEAFALGMQLYATPRATKVEAKKVVYMVDLFLEAKDEKHAKKLLARLEKITGNMATRFEKVVE